MKRAVMTACVSLLGLSALAGCEPEETSAKLAPLPPDGQIALQVESEQVTATSVALIARHQSLDVAAAADYALFDAVLAAQARKELSARAQRLLANTALARALMAGEWHALRDQPVTEVELEEATAALWTKYARPEGRRTAHFIILVKPDDPPEAHAEAKAAIGEILEVVRTAVAEKKDEPPPNVPAKKAFVQGAFSKDPLYLAFKSAAEAEAERLGRKVTVQELLPATRDAIQIASGPPRGSQAFDKAYVAAAWELASRGALSGVVQSSFGYHGILLLEATPANMVPADDRRRLLSDKIAEVRAIRFRRGLLEELEKKTTVELMANHEALLGQLDFGRRLEVGKNDARLEVQP